MIETYERKLSELDGTEQGALFASGGAAVSTAVFALLEPGEQIVATVPMRSEVQRFLGEVGRRFGVQTTFVAAGTDTVAAIREEAARIKADRLRMIWVESPADPTNV